MKKTFLFLVVTILTSISNAVDFTVELTPAANSVGDTQLSAISISKVTGLQTSLNSKADQSSVTSSLALKADISSLGALATLNTVGDAQVSSISNTKITGLGTLSTKSTITNTEVSNGALSSSKISGLGPFATASSLLASDIPSLLSSKISDFASSVISAMSSHKVIFRGTSNAGTNLPFNTFVNIPFVSMKDTHSAWNGSAFVVPSGEGGTYRVSVFLMTGNGFTASSGGTIDCRIFKNGLSGDLLAMNRSVTSFSSKYFELTGTDIIDVVPGDTIEIRVYQTLVNATIPLLTAADYNHLSIVKEH